MAGPRHALILRSKGQRLNLNPNARVTDLHSPGVGLDVATTAHFSSWQMISLYWNYRLFMTFMTKERKIYYYAGKATPLFLSFKTPHYFRYYIDFVSNFKPGIDTSLVECNYCGALYARWVCTQIMVREDNLDECASPIVSHISVTRQQAIGSTIIPWSISQAWSSQAHGTPPHILIMSA